jgi:hypothetical protein
MAADDPAAICVFIRNKLFEKSFFLPCKNFLFMEEFFRKGGGSLSLPKEFLLVRKQ